MLTTRGEVKLQNCDIPISEEEWVATPTAIKWGTLEISKFAYRGEKKVKLEVDTERVAPSSAKPPPPEPPPTYSRDRAVGKGSGKGKGKDSRWKGNRGQECKGESKG